MTNERVINPTKFQAYVLASRPKTLILSLVPILVGTVLGLEYARKFNIGLLISALLSSFIIQIAVNLINDALDFKKGADNDARLGADRATQKGWLSFDEVYRAGLACLALSFVTGLPLIIYGGYYFFILLVLSSLMAYCYTGGPYPLAYNGLGEIFVILFFGFFGTLAGFYLQTFYVENSVFLAGFQVGLLAASVNAINNLRDVESDRVVNKKTWAVRFGTTFARFEITFLVLTPFFLNLFWSDFGFYKAGLLPFVTLPLAFTLVRCIWYYEPSKIYNNFLAMAALLTFLFSIFLSIGFWLS